MALAPRRLASLAAGLAVAASCAVLAQAPAASAADPITGQAAPTITAPANDVTTALKDVVLQWTSVPYADAYQVQVSPNGDFTNNKIQLLNSGLTVNTSYELPVSLPHDTYYWRVRAVDAGGHTGWSAQSRFLHDWFAPLTMLQTPTSANPTWAWAPVPEASLYEVEVSTVPDFAPDNTHQCWTAATEFTLYDPDNTPESTLSLPCFGPKDLPAASTPYYWLVRAWDDSTAPTIEASNAPSSGFDCATAQPECAAQPVRGQFVYQPVAPSGTAALPPVTGVTTTWHTTSLPGNPCDAGANPCPTTPTFSWTPVPGANQYEVVIFRDPAGTNVYRAYTTDWASLTPREALLDAQAGQAYYWAVQALRTGCTDNTTCVNAAGGSAGLASFDKQSGPVTLSAPADRTRVRTQSVTFSWVDYLAAGSQGSMDVRNYHLQVATDPAFTNLVIDNPNIDMTRWTDPAAFLPDGVYYWRVAGIDESSNDLTWSTARKFTLDAAPPVFALTSHNGARVTSNLHVAASESDIRGTVSARSLQVFSTTTGAAVRGTWQKTSAQTWTFNPTGVLTPGDTYALKVLGGLTDAPGNAAVASSRTVRTNRLVDDRNAAVHYGRGWTQHRSSNAIRHTYSVGTSSASIVLVGSKVAVYGCKGPALGRVSVSVDGVHKVTVNEKQGFSQCHVLLWHGSFSPDSVHVVRVAASRGRVAFDALELT